jgi:phosphatidylserine decarboxylase
MRIHKEGIRIILMLLGLVLLILFLVNWFFPHQTPVHYFLYVLGFLFMIAVGLFFRHPKREGPGDEKAIFSPADGKIIHIAVEAEDEYFKDKRLKVSIFMSLLNIHVNRFPVSGKISYIKYHPGKFLLAYLPKSSKLNEHNSIVIETTGGHKILVRQIAGVVARRIICYSATGDPVIQRNEIGIIKFGSRVDLFLPLDTEITVALHQKVKGGTSVIGKLH